MSKDCLPTLLFPENITWICLGSKGVLSGHTVGLGSGDGHLGRTGILFNPRGPFQQHKQKEKAGRQDDKFPTLVRTGDGRHHPRRQMGCQRGGRSG